MATTARGARGHSVPPVVVTGSAVVLVLGGIDARRNFVQRRLLLPAHTDLLGNTDRCDIRGLDDRDHPILPKMASRVSPSLFGIV